MNIFILDINPVLAAQYQCDKHVVKMVLESAQILSTINGGPYKPTHANHPCVAWARENSGNYAWLALHAIALCHEYTTRYGKRHKCEDIIADLLCIPFSIPREYRTPFIQCMPEQYRGDDAVKAYRRYYVSEKAKFARWTNRNIPQWFIDMSI